MMTISSNPCCSTNHRFHCTTQDEVVFTVPHMMTISSNPCCSTSRRFRCTTHDNDSLYHTRRRFLQIPAVQQVVVFAAGVEAVVAVREGVEVDVVGGHLVVAALQPGAVHAAAEPGPHALRPAGQVGRECRRPAHHLGQLGVLDRVAVVVARGLRARQDGQLRTERA